MICEQAPPPAESRTKPPLFSAIPLVFAILKGWPVRLDGSRFLRFPLPDRDSGRLIRHLKCLPEPPVSLKLIFQPKFVIIY